MADGVGGHGQILLGLRDSCKEHEADEWQLGHATCCVGLAARGADKAAEEASGEGGDGNPARVPSHLAGSLVGWGQPQPRDEGTMGTWILPSLEPPPSYKEEWALEISSHMARLSPALNAKSRADEFRSDVEGSITIPGSTHGCIHAARFTSMTLETELFLRSENVVYVSANKKSFKGTLPAVLPSCSAKRVIACGAKH